MKIVSKVDEKASEILFKRLIKNSKDLKRPLINIRATLLSSTDKTFEAQGRPRKWKDLKPSTKRKRAKMGKWPAKILQVSGSLASSVNGKIEGNTVKIGSNKEYAMIHQKGGTIKTKKASIKIPARPFLVIQDEDVKRAENILTRHLLKK